jgi:hypothetical protein
MGLRSFALKLLIFLSPFLVYLMVVVTVDPFNMFTKNGLFKNPMKEKYATTFDEILWKMVKFEKHPVENILLGDSRMRHVDVNNVDSLSSISFFNFAYGGSTLPEECATFWYAARRARLKHVFWEISFYVFNARQSNDRSKRVLTLLNNKFLYLYDNTVCRTLYFSLKGSAGADELGKPKEDKNQFWSDQLKLGAQCYSKYQYPTQCSAELKRISEYCRQNGIDLEFIIFPTHCDLQRVVEKENLVEEQRKFLTEIYSLGKTYDFDFENSMTLDSNNFADPFHCTSTYRDIVIRAIFKPDTTIQRYARYQ